MLSPVFTTATTAFGGDTVSLKKKKKEEKQV